MSIYMITFYSVVSWVDVWWLSKAFAQLKNMQTVCRLIKGKDIDNSESNLKTNIPMMRH